MHPIEPHLMLSYRDGDVRELHEHLEAAGTFQFPVLPTGLFSAAAATSSEFEYTGYSAVWVRDNVHIAHMFHVIGQSDVAARAVAALTRFFHTQCPKLEAIVTGQVALHSLPPKQEAMLRPHIRFNGQDGTELSEPWAHAQNDALGYWMWLYCKLLADGQLQPQPADLQLLAAFVRYFEANGFWADEDSGHWEEARKVEASSIGVVTAGLQTLQRLLQDRPEWAAECRFQGVPVFSAVLDRLIDEGRRALDTTLPYECRQAVPGKQRRYDSALLFLIYPVDIVSGAMADQIVDDVVEQLLGPYGIRRYLGDSYWCQDYKALLAPERRTSDFSAEQGSRDRLLKPGGEAQWCLFDPLLSVIHGLRYQATRDPARLHWQTHHLNRSLRQLTGEDTPFPPLRCPESYYCESGRYVPNDITPLLWTQANLRLALHCMERSASLAE